MKPLERLAEIREHRALTLRELGVKSGVNANTINQVELGSRKPRPSTLRKLARALDVEVADFFRDEIEAKHCPSCGAESQFWQRVPGGVK